MNTLDKKYQDLLQDILDNGVEKSDRTGTGTLSVFGRQIRHNMKDGFPLLTTKKMAWKTIVTELLWFLRGETNIKFLVDNGCHIWDGDAYKNYQKTMTEWFGNESQLTKEQFIDKIKTDNEFASKWGELGPIYGKQWREWDIKNGYEPIDQIQNLINELKTNPDSRRLLVSAWNVGELDQMVLPPCHYGFQVYTTELSLDERMEFYYKNNLKSPKQESISRNHTNEQKLQYLKVAGALYPIPTRAISLMWNQRSCDFPLGIPMNIASYGLLLEIISKEVNMVPDELIGNFGDCHIYLNQIDGVKEQIGRKLSFDERYALYTGNSKTWEEDGGNAWGKINGLDIMDDAKIPTHIRQPFRLPRLVHTKTEAYYNSLSESMTLIGHLDPKDFRIENYQSHPSIKAPLSN